MNRMFFIAVVIILALHGLIHLLGTTVYLKLGTVEGLAYKTALLNGQWEVGEGGMRVFGLCWAVAAVGFVAAALAFGLSWAWWQPWLLGVTLFSLALTALDWRTAYAGVVVNLVILALLWFGPRWR